MKIVIEDFYGNDICSFECNEFKNPFSNFIVKSTLVSDELLI